MSYIETLGQQLGSQAATGALGTIMGLVMEKHNDQRQIQQQQKLTDMQITGSKAIMDYQQKLAYENWLKTNYGPQMEQMKKAGLNPALLYGMSGGGGATMGNPSGNVSTASAQQNPGEVQQFAGMGIQSGAAMADIQLKNAQARNLDADTKKKLEGDIPNIQAGTTKIGAEIESIKQGIQNQKAQEALTKVQTALNDLDLQFNEESYDDRIDLIIRSVSIATEQYHQAERETYIKRATADKVIDTIRTGAATAVIQNELLKAGIAKTQMETAASKASINKMANEIAQNWDNIDIRQFEADLKAAYPTLGQGIGNAIQQGIKELQDAVGEKDDTPRRVKRSSGRSYKNN